MDVFEALKELHKETTVDTLRRPLIPAEKTNGITTRQPRTREVGSRYKSPSNSRRCPSPNPTRTVNSSSSSSQLASKTAKRAISAERKRPSSPSSPSRPSTPVSDTSAESQLSSKKITGSRLPEVLWPSTMRSLSVSFQTDSISIPVSKKEKPVSHHALSDRTLKQSSNVAQKQAETSTTPRKSTPERKRSPLKGKNSSRESENSRPVDSLQSRLIDQHRWPSRVGVKSSSSMLAKSMEFSGKIPSSPLPSIGTPSLRRLSAEGIPRPLHKTSSDSSSGSSDDIGTLGLHRKSVDDSLLRLSALHKTNAFSSSERVTSRMPSPSRASVSKGTPSPSRTRPSTPTQSRGTTLSKTRPSSPIRQSSSTTSVLSFIADIKKGKKNNQLEDVHQLRLLYNRYLQWRFANARGDATLYIQKITAEQSLYNVWQENLELRDSMIRKRIDLQLLNLELKLNHVLSEQMAYLEDWALLEGDHSTSLNGAIKDLEASTLRLPVTGGAKVDIDSLKAAMSSAVDVMQAMGSYICSILLKVEGMNGLVSELADLAGQQRAMLNECDILLASTAALQVKEYSLRTQLIQSREDLWKTRRPLLWAT